MQLLALFPAYIYWHYTRAILDYYRVADNILWFIFNFFSIDILLKTLFSPWRRLSKDEGSSRPTFFSNLVINIIMRLVGLLIRGVTIVFGSGLLVFAGLAFVLGFIAWLGLPFLIVAIFFYGVGYFL